MANWDFTVDSDIQRELADNLENKANNYEERVHDMYSQINAMSEFWVGEDYNLFKEGTEGYKNALQDLSDGIKMYAIHFEKLADGTDELSQELINIVENMTGSGQGTINGGFSSGPSAGGSFEVNDNQTSDNSSFMSSNSDTPLSSSDVKRSEERRVGKECRL